jgi:hypothetical protein
MNGVVALMLLPQPALAAVMLFVGEPVGAADSTCRTPYAVRLTLKWALILGARPQPDNARPTARM